MSKKGKNLTNGQKFEECMKIIVSQQFISKEEKFDPKTLPIEEVRKLYAENDITEEVFRNYCIFRGEAIEDIEKLQEAIFHPSEVDSDSSGSRNS